MNAKLFKSSGVGISEQFPPEIEKTRKRLFLEFKKAKVAAKKVKMVRDKLFINGVVFKPTK